MLHLQRDLHSSYFPQVTDCLAHGCPTVYEMQTLQQLKLWGPNIKGPISILDLPFSTLYATFKRQISETEGNRGPEVLLQWHSLLYLQSCKWFYEYHSTKKFKINSNSLSVLQQREALLVVSQGLATGEQLHSYPCVQICIHTQASESYITKSSGFRHLWINITTPLWKLAKEVYLKGDSGISPLLPGQALFHLNAVS